MTENEIKTLHYAEGSPWFWRIFGGAIIGLVTVLLISYIANINANQDRSFFEFKSDIKEMRQVLDGYRDRLSAFEQGSYKERIAALEKTITELRTSLSTNQQKVAAAEAQLLVLKDEITALRDSSKDVMKQIQMIREKQVAEEATKKTKP